MIVAPLRMNILLGFVAVPNQDPDYMDQLSPENYSNHLQRDTERAIAQAAAEQEDRSPEALLNAVCTPQMLAHAPTGTPRYHHRGSIQRAVLTSGAQELLPDRPWQLSSPEAGPKPAVLLLVTRGCIQLWS